MLHLRLVFVLLLFPSVGIAQSGPDLVITSMTFSPTTVPVLGNVQIIYTVENIGTASCGMPTNLGFYISLDNIIENNGSDYQIGVNETIPDLLPGGSHSNSVSVNVGPFFGLWWIGGYADNTELLAGIELDTANGFAAGTVEIITVPPGPTMAVSNLVAGQTAQVDFMNCSANGKVYFVWSISGGGPISTPYGTGYVSPPYRVTHVQMGVFGTASLNQAVPSSASGINIWFHGADVGYATTLNPLALTIQ